MSKRIIISAILAIATSIAAVAANPIDDGRRQYLNGDYEQAVATLQPLLRKSPRDGNVNFYLGASLLALGRTADAIGPLTTAEGRGVVDASRLLAEIALESYDIDEADEHLEVWAEALRKNKKPVPESYNDMKSHLVKMRNMMQRVESIVVIDSMVVDAADFFEHYRLSPEVGRLMDPSILKTDEASMVFIPENGREIYWAQVGEDGYYHLMTSAVLDDGTTQHPEELDASLGRGGDANYPFMMPDGLTFYYASNGEGSIGGYDIFLTRRTDEGFFVPQNIGMPYNSPYDDYMLVIDERTGAGWWATDRNQIPGKVTIYMFVPSETRVNCAPDDPQLAERARLSQIALTQDPSANYDALRQAIAAQPNSREAASRIAEKRQGRTFAMSMGDGHTVYRTLDDFRNPQARREMVTLLDTRAEIAGLERRLRSLRTTYAEGNKSVAGEIVNLENRLSEARGRETRLVNSVVRLEGLNR